MTYGKLNGFEQPCRNTDTTDSIRDNPLFINGSVAVGGTYYEGSVLVNNYAVAEYSTATAITPTGIALIAGGTGIANLTLVAPKPGYLLKIRLASITSGTVVVKTATGVTFDGTNNTATFDAVDDMLILGYKSATEWIVVENNSVVLSST